MYVKGPSALDPWGIAKPRIREMAKPRIREMAVFPLFYVLMFIACANNN